MPTFDRPLSDVIDEKMLLRIFRSDSSNLVQLMRIADGSPDSFYVDADLSECSFEDQDLSRLNLTGANLRGVKISSKTSLNASALLNASLRIDYLTIARRAQLASTDRPEIALELFASSAGLSHVDSYPLHGREADMKLTVRTVGQRIEDAHNARIFKALPSKTLALRNKALLSFPELHCFARFLAQKDLPWETTLEDQFDVWRFKRMTDDDPRFELVTVHRDGPSYVLIDVAELLNFFTEREALRPIEFFASLVAYANTIVRMDRNDARFRDFHLIA